MINIDAGFEAGRGGTGIVIRDAGGGFVAVVHKYLPHVGDAQMSEAYALKDGLMLAQELG